MEGVKSKKIPYSFNNTRDQDDKLLEPYAHIVSVPGTKS